MSFHAYKKPCLALFAAGSAAADGALRYPRLSGHGYLSPDRSCDARYSRHQPAVVQLTLSLYMVMLGLGQIVFGPVSDRIGRRPVLIGGAMLFAAASFCLAASSSAIPFVAFRFLQAVGASAALVATFATIRDVYADRPESVVIYSLFSSILAFVPALGPITGAMLAERFGWRSIFVTLGALAIIALLQALPRWHESRPSAAALSRHAFGPFSAASPSGPIPSASAPPWARSSCSFPPRRAC